MLLPNERKFLKLLRDAKKEGADNVWADYMKDQLNIDTASVNALMHSLSSQGYIKILVSGGAWGGSNFKITEKGVKELSIS